MAGLWRVSVDWTGTGAVGGGLSTHYFTVAGGTAANAVTAVSTFWTAVDNFISSQMTWNIDDEVQEIESTTGILTGSTFVSVGGNTGGSSNTMLAPQTQGLIQWRTTTVVAGRILRGRTFVPGPTTDQLSGAGVPAPLYLTGLTTAATALRTDGNSELVVYSRKHKVFGIVTDNTSWQKFATLRGRRD